MWLTCYEILFMIYFNEIYDNGCSLGIIIKEIYLRVKTWAHKLGFELSQLGKYVTNVEKFSESYKAAKFLPQDGNDLVREIAKSIKAMMDSKISAIKVRSFLKN